LPILCMESEKLCLHILYLESEKPCIFQRRNSVKGILYTDSQTKLYLTEILIQKLDEIISVGAMYL
jgi:hypothetical protein